MNQFKTLRQIADNQKYTIIGKTSQQDKQFLTKTIDISKKILVVMNIKDNKSHKPLYKENYFERVYRYKRNISFDDVFYVHKRKRTRWIKGLDMNKKNKNIVLQSYQKYRKSTSQSKMALKPMNMNGSVHKKKSQLYENKNSLNI